MDSIIHQASPTNENQAELTPLTQPNDGSPGKSGQGRSSRSGGGFLRSLLCCFTGGAEPIAEPVLPQDPIGQPQDERPPTEPEPCPQQPIVRLIFGHRIAKIEFRFDQLRQINRYFLPCLKITWTGYAVSLTLTKR